MNPRSCIFSGYLVITIILASWTWGGAQPQVEPQQAALFREGPTISHREQSPTISKRRAVYLNPEVLKKGRGRGARLPLNLFPEANFVGIVQKVTSKSDSVYILEGVLENHESSSFVVSVNGDASVMNIRPDAGLIQVRYLGDGLLHEIQQIDENQFPPCETGPAQEIDAPENVRARDAVAEADDGNFIDVLVVYTPSARTAAGGTGSMEALVNLAITESNSAYQESGIATRLRLAHVTMVSYTESDSYNTDLSRLANASDGYIDDVHSLRMAHAADMVSLWVNNSSSCGIGYVMTTLSSGFKSFAFSTVHYGCATGYYSFGHELGHNMGCRHDRENSSGGGLNSYSYGWRFKGTNNVEYRTVMAYAPGTRVPRFSNPNVNYRGTPTGVTIGQTNEAYNAQTINNSAYTIANFFQESTASGPPVIVSSPTSKTVSPGASVEFLVSHTGAAPFSYQWRKDGNNLPGATYLSYKIANVQSVHAGNYSVVITNSLGQAVSSAATLAVAIPLSDALDHSGLGWTTGGNAGWIGQLVTSYDGTDAAQSGAISHSQQSWLQTSISGPGTLMFRWKVSSEFNYDFFRVSLDGALQASIHGEVGWQLKTIEIPSGVHTVRWAYEKDFSESAGQDRAWLDQIVFAAPSTLNGATAVLTNGMFGFEIIGTAGASYTVYASTNLTTWTAVTNFTSTNGIPYFIDRSSSNHTRRFYRIGSP